MTTNCLSAAELLSREGIDVGIVHFHTIKPLDEVAVLEYADIAQLLVTVEEGTAIGGFGSAVTDLLVEKRAKQIPRILRLAISDTFPHKYGTQNDLCELYGLTPPQIAGSVLKSLGAAESVI
jgi:transketolase C-terminal domain/subunit